jgi:hypothetical protein
MKDGGGAVFSWAPVTETLVKLISLGEMEA